MENIEEIRHILVRNTREITRDFLKRILRANRVQFVERDTRPALIERIVTNLNPGVLIRNLTVFAADTDQQGLRSVLHPETPRHERVKEEMEQRLHHQSCYIYFYLKSQGIHPNEVQMMCARRQGHPDRYFLAVNFYAGNNRGNANYMERVRRVLGVTNNIIGLNIGNPQIHELIIEGHNFRTINGRRQQTPAEKRKQNIIDGLQNNEFLDFTGVEFVTNENAYNGRHAEEFLCDRAIELRDEDPNTEFFIYGKRRPSITCKVKMETARIDHFNRNHGRLFLHTTDGNRLTNDERTRVIEILVEEPSNITMRIRWDEYGRIIEQETTTHYASDDDE